MRSAAWPKSHCRTAIRPATVKRISTGAMIPLPVERQCAFATSVSSFDTFDCGLNLARPRAEGCEAYHRDPCILLIFLSQAAKPAVSGGDREGCGRVPPQHLGVRCPRP